MNTIVFVGCVCAGRMDDEHEGFAGNFSGRKRFGPRTCGEGIRLRRGGYVDKTERTPDLDRHHRGRLRVLRTNGRKREKITYMSGFGSSSRSDQAHVARLTYYGTSFTAHAFPEFTLIPFVIFTWIQSLPRINKIQTRSRCAGTVRRHKRIWKGSLRYVQ